MGPLTPWQNKKPCFSKRLYIYEAIQAKLKDNTIVCTSLLINAEFSKLKTSNWALLRDNLSLVVCEQRALFFVY